MRLLTGYIFLTITLSVFARENHNMNNISDNEDKPQFRIVLNSGYSRHITYVNSKTLKKYINYAKSLRSGYHVEAKTEWCFTEYSAIGIKWNVFKTSKELDSIYIEDAFLNRLYGKMSDDITILYIGPEYSYQFELNNKHKLFFSASAGYIGYRNNLVMIEEFYKKANTYGGALDIGYDYNLSKRISIGLQITCLGGYIFKYTLDNGTTIETIKLDKNEYEWLNRLDISAGIRIKL